MASREFFEKTSTRLSGLNRNQLTNQIKNFKGRFRLDFTEEYLQRLSDDRLRHILLAAVITSKS
jgi:hypothetical protein